MVMLAAFCLLTLAACATGPEKVRKDRDEGLKDGDFLSALAQSRTLYRSEVATLPDVAAHCGLVFAVSNYTEARECTERLLGAIESSEANIELDLKQQIAQAWTERGRSFLPDVLVLATRGGVLRDGYLDPGWRHTRYGVEAVLALHNLRWRALYLRGKISLETGDHAAAKEHFTEAHELVTRRWDYADGSLTLAALLEGSEDWRFQGGDGKGSNDTKAWWIDLLCSLSIASSMSGDTEAAHSAIGELQALDPPRELRGYLQSRLVYANMAAGRLADAKSAADKDPEQFRRTLRVGGGILGGGLLIYTLLTVAAITSAPVTGLGAALTSAVAAVSTLIVGLTLSMLTLTVSRIAGKDTTWDLTQRWYAVARISRETGDNEKADAIYKKLLDEDEVLQSQPGIQWQVYFDVARWHEAAGRDDDAVRLYERSIDVIEATRRNIAAESAKIGFAADKQHVYQRLMLLKLKRGQVAQAFELSERARARALLDILATRDWTQAVDAQVAQEGELLRLIETQESEARLAILQDKPAEASQRRSAIRHLAERIQVADPQIAALTQVRNYQLGEIRERLSPNELLLSFAPAGEQIVAFAISRDEIKHWTFAAGEMNARVGLLRHAIDQHSVNEGVTQELSRQLFAGLPAMGRFGRLSIVPTGALHALPFAALQAEAGPLPPSVSLRVLPSASVLPLLQSRARQVSPMTVAAFGNPDFGGLFPELPNTEGEVAKVAAIIGSGRALVGRDASKANVLRTSGASTVLHFATHGQFDAQRPLQSALYLSDGQGGAAALTASDIYGMRIAARLVTLSACETGLGTVKSGDEVIGLYRALLFAGADTVVASLWEVDDASTSFLMTRFYAHLKTHTAPESLHLAQRDTAAQWPDPYHWAGFSVIGLERPFDPTPGLSPPPSTEAPVR